MSYSKSLGLLLLLQCTITGQGMAQFYPNAQACWDGWDDDGGPPSYEVSFRMGLTPDTLINGVVYKRIDEYRMAEYTRSYFVRSDPNGKGYAYLPDSAAEFLTGDLSAEAGDTVQNVLWRWTGAFDVAYSLQNTLIDSVVTLSNLGVSVTRHYVNDNGFLGGPRFWQAGAGTCYGPMLEVSGSAGSCLVVDTAMFGFNADGLLPGPVGEIICSVPGLGVNDPGQPPALQAFPNPSADLFTFDPRIRSATVYDAVGTLLFATHTPRIDLSAYPPGLYYARVQWDEGMGHLRLVVQR